MKLYRDPLRIASPPQFESRLTLRNFVLEVCRVSQCHTHAGMGPRLGQKLILGEAPARLSFSRY
jgi:hypothetical protein